MTNQESKLSEEIKSFEHLWKGGYYEGDPLNPMAKSGYWPIGFMSVLHATYLCCIKPYVNAQTVALEIGPGRGAFTKTLLPSKEVYALDALPEEHNKFFEYLCYPKNVKYFQVQDFECKVLPDDYFNYMFSFGCLCHISFEGIKQYAINLFPKLKHDSNCFWMISDYDKYNTAVLNQHNLSCINTLTPSSRRFLPLKWLLKYSVIMKRTKLLSKDEDDEPKPGRWYHAGIERTCSMLREVGYRIIDPDIGTILRDPIVHFIKD